LSVEPILLLDLDPAVPRRRRAAERRRRPHPRLPGRRARRRPHERGGGSRALSQPPPRGGVMRRSCAVTAAAIALLLCAAAPADAYVGPGAGFALLSSFFIFFTTIVIAIVSLLVWPFRAVARMLRRSAMAYAKIGRLIVVGFD